jgi:hypothetical protein
MATCSRYDFMNEGLTADELSGSYYPDPLSLNYLNLQMTSVPIKDTIDDTKAIFFWKEAEDLYGVAGYDDVVLTLNGVPHKNFLMPGDTVYFPSKEDIQNSYSKSRRNS